MIASDAVIVARWVSSTKQSASTTPVPAFHGCLHRATSSVVTEAVSRKEVRTIAGSSAGFLDANGSAALFSRPIDVAFDDNSGMLYMTDFYNHRIRVIHVASTVVTTLAGSGTKAFADGVGTSAKFANPSGIAVTSDGSHLFVADMFNNRIRMIATATASVTTVAGSNNSGYKDGMALEALFNQPSGIDVRSDGAVVYVVDTKVGITNPTLESHWNLSAFLEKQAP